MNLKGGTGKTSAIIHLAAAIKASGQSVLITDSDPQSDALNWADALGWDAISLPTKSIHKQKWLSDSHDHVLIDTPPGDLGIVASAMRAADLIVVPVQPTGGDFAQYAETASLIEEIQATKGNAAAALLTRVVKKTVAATQIRAALQPFEIPVLATEIPQKQLFAMAYGKLPAADATYESLLAELRGIAHE
ncbi:ParA family protein [Vibrio vulnificus]|uniref:ParA family protein n=1 Tax=Vibrio vulnificus TaxID=672 RepID=UPI00102F7F27|nr:ParA family protein [Vibrio vulnificus]